jgi:hypothetical protein
MAHGGDPGRRPRALGTSAEGASMALSPTTARPPRLVRRGAAAARLAAVEMIEHRPLANCS